MRISFRAMIATWILSLAVAFGFKMTIHSSGGSDVERGIASLSGVQLTSHNSRSLPAGFCFQAENYACEWRTYGPAETDSSLISRECVQSLAHNRNNDQICLQVLKINFHSETVSANQIPASEVKCTMRGLGPRFQLESEAADLTTAMDFLMGRCMNQMSEVQ